MLVAVLVISGTAAFAATKQNPKDNGAYVIITNNDTGHKFQIPFYKLGKESLTGNLAGTDITKTYKFNIDKNVMNWTDGSLTSEECDTSNVQGYLKLIYKEASNINGKGHRVILTNVNGKWVNKNNAVTLSDRKVYYACADGGNQRQCTFKYPSGNRFSYNTGFSYSVNDAVVSSACGAKMMATLHRGSSSSWTFEVRATSFSNSNFPDFPDIMTGISNGRNFLQ